MKHVHYVGREKAFFQGDLSRDSVVCVLVAYLTSHSTTLATLSNLTECPLTRLFLVKCIQHCHLVAKVLSDLNVL